MSWNMLKERSAAPITRSWVSGAAACAEAAMSDLDTQLEAMRTAHRATARYTVYLSPADFVKDRTVIETGLTWDVATAKRDSLNASLGERRFTSPMYCVELEKPPKVTGRSAPATPAPRELLYAWVADCLAVLVPKQRGSGYLRMPYGNHAIAGLDAVATAIGCDVFGLDGALEIQCGGAVYHGGAEARRAFAEAAIPLLQRHYAMAAREINTVEYWLLHPHTNKG
jgi:hypothetical protein